jgi:DNA-binding IclR family transcriptional regulator
MEIARLARLSYGLSEVALPAMTALSQDLGETVLLTRRAGDLVVCVERVEPELQGVRISYERGSTQPLNAGASALVLLAWSPDDEVRRLLEGARLRRFTPATVTDVDSLMERMAEIRELGYATSKGELDPDVCGIAAPIRDQGGLVVAAVSVVALASRVDAQVQDDIIKRTLNAARAIGERLASVAG